MPTKHKKRPVMIDGMTRDALMQHALQCGLNQRAARKWVSEQFVYKRPRVVVPAAEVATLPLFEGAMSHA